MKKTLLKTLALMLCLGGLSGALPIEVGAQIPQQSGSKVEDVELEVPYTSLLIRGIASPGALVTIFIEDELAGSVIADDQGIFEKVLNSVSAGLHKVSLEYTDKEGLKSDRVTEIISARLQDQIATDFFMPPTVQILPNIVTQGDLMVIRGSTAPGATVEVVLDGGRAVVYPIADEDGVYSITVDTTGYYVGNHSLAVMAIDGLLSSYTSNFKPFSVSAPDTGVVTTEGGDLSTDPFAGQGPDPPIIDASSVPAETESDRVVIRGTAEPYSQILIYIDNVAVGSTFANGEGEWVITLRIHGGLNQIQAITCHEGLCSGLSDIANVTFIGDLGLCNGRTFNLVSYRFWDHQTGDTVTLNVHNQVFNTPMRVLIDWGDETSEFFELDSSEPFNPQHIYEQEGQFNASISIEDDDGCELTRYFTVDVQDDFRINQLWWAPIGVIISGLLFWEVRRLLHKRHQRLIAANEDNTNHSVPVQSSS